jgi:hypothetical protein
MMLAMSCSMFLACGGCTMYSTSIVCIERISHPDWQSSMESNVKFLIHYLTKKTHSGEAPLGLFFVKSTFVYVEFSKFGIKFSIFFLFLLKKESFVNTKLILGSLRYSRSLGADFVTWMRKNLELHPICLLAVWPVSVSYDTGTCRSVYSVRNFCTVRFGGSSILWNFAGTPFCKFGGTFFPSKGGLGPSKRGQKPPFEGKKGFPPNVRYQNVPTLFSFGIGW